MIQWIGILVALAGLAYTGIKDYQKGDIKIPKIPSRQKIVYPIQYCLMAYDPNLDKVFYLHDNGIWYDYAPPQRRYQQTTTQYHQNQGQTALGTGNRPQGGSSGYVYGQSAQAAAYTPRH